jgi:transcriptional regulator with XRE-family HTH domain
MHSSQRDYHRGKLLKKLRVARRLSQAQLAQRLGVSTQTVYNWERGKHWQQIDNIAILCQVLEISVHDLSAIDSSTVEIINDRVDNINTASNKESRIDLVRRLLKTEDCEFSSRSPQESE